MFSRSHPSWPWALADLGQPHLPLSLPQAVAMDKSWTQHLLGWLSWSCCFPKDFHSQVSSVLPALHFVSSRGTVAGFLHAALIRCVPANTSWWMKAIKNWNDCNQVMWYCNVKLVIRPLHVAFSSSFFFSNFLILPLCSLCSAQPLNTRFNIRYFPLFLSQHLTKIPLSCHHLLHLNNLCQLRGWGSVCE